MQVDETHKLSLERPYKNDKGEPILELVDITEDGTHVLEPRRTVTQSLGENFRRIFVERGVDFFDKLKAGEITDDEDIASTQAGSPSGEHDNVDETSPNDNPMSPEEVTQLRQDMQMQLHVAQGEISFARDLLTILLSPSDQNYPVDVPRNAFGTTSVTRPGDITSVQAFNSQLILGGKDEALRKAATAFKAAADTLERVRSRGEKYWRDALDTRSANWSLVPSPLPVGSQVGKGTDKSARDFWISFGLAESPVTFKQRAVAHLAVHNSDRSPLVFPRHQHTRMRVSLIKTDETGKQHTFHETCAESEDETIHSRLVTSRNEIVDQEIFSQLIKEAATLPTASARVSERLIAVEVAQNLELRFELFETPWEASSIGPESAICDLVHSCLVLLLLRSHRHTRCTRLSLSQGQSNRQRSVQTPQLLLPVVNILQYKVFYLRIESELNAMAGLLTRAGVPNKIHFSPIGETGLQLVEFLSAEERLRIGGDATLRVNKHHTLHFTFQAPSSLSTSLPQAILSITSVPQLYHILRDEVQKGLLNDIRKLGEKASMSKGGSWFVDQISARVVGRWEGTVITCKLHFGDERTPELVATVVQIKGKPEGKVVLRYSPDLAIPLLSWISDTVRTSCLNQSGFP